jgi:Flp pilus assembly protein TadD
VALAYGDHEAAQQAYAKAVAIDPARWETHLGLAWALEGQNRSVNASVEYEKVLALRPGQEEALFGLGMALKADNQLAAAKAAFEQLLATSGASRATDARAQIASIDLRLRTAAATQAERPAAAAPVTGEPAGGGRR